MKLKFIDKYSEFNVEFDFLGNQIYINMSRAGRGPDKYGRYSCDGWYGKYEDCPYFSYEARKFFDKALTMKVFW